MNRDCRRVILRLSDYLDHELRGAALLQVEAHLAHCPLCRHTCDSLARTLRLVQVYRHLLPGSPRDLLD